ncbi:3-deoxy-7-phosphoheptulonate synthase [Entomophthora muscae]|uniref:3-deoxy-7-phosphoheptulonate synthase n=1 Tax=Entomophthora muscae TaxID=34485 RepID=A0ACC2UHX0_9FUNG|nr:3-deoxy-7-phosphoheptulonate synthase [Entomophthora muscae]
MKIFRSGNDTNEPTQDLKIEGYKPLIPPQILEMEIPVSTKARATVKKARDECIRILEGKDDRVVVVVGPCSIHDPNAALEYGKKLREVRSQFEGELLIIMRAYFEKPRTTVGWKGLINDPDMDQSFNINKGLKMGRKLLNDLNEMDIPVGCELLDTITPQLHRELASGVSFPVGFKNGTDGNAKIAIDAIHAASHPHHFLGVTDQGLASIVVTKGNGECHIILRGSNTGPNYESQYVTAIADQLQKSKLPQNIMVDCSHGNSSKKHKNQILVASNLARQIAAGDKSIMGCMIESNLREGRQDVPPEGPDFLKFGVSITDACVSFDDTIPMLTELAEAVKQRRLQK